MSSNLWLTKEQFCKISPLLPNKPRGVPRVDERRVLSGIILCIQRGYRWSTARQSFAQRNDEREMYRSNTALQRRSAIAGGGDRNELEW